MKGVNLPAMLASLSRFRHKQNSLWPHVEDAVCNATRPTGPTFIALDVLPSSLLSSMA